MFASVALTRSSTRARDSGGIFIRNSSKVLALPIALLLDPHEAFVVKAIRDRHENVIPARVPRLVPANQQDRRALWIECIKDAVWAPLMLNSRMCACLLDETPEHRG